MKANKKKIKELIKDSKIRINKNTGGICSLKYLAEHPEVSCENCKRKVLCDLIAEYQDNIEQKK